MKRHALSLVFLALNSCAAPAASLKPDEAVRHYQNVQMLSALDSLGHDGDWLVVRGYSVADDFISNVTNAAVSHVAVLDLENRSVIESDASGVHATPLDAFVTKVHRLILIRPVWSAGAAVAIGKARSLVGKKYDFSGLVGIDHPERYYCSELAMRIYADFQDRRHEIPIVIEPAHMYLWGTILYDSRPRHWNLP